VKKSQPIKIPGKEALQAPLPKRFYGDVAVGSCEEGFTVLLDGRPVRTPRKHLFALPSRALAEAVAAEWAAQAERIDPSAMPLTRLAVTALDGVVGHTAEVAADIVKYAGSDLLCYRAEAPAALVRQQASAWDPVLRWAEKDLGARFALAAGVMPVEQRRVVLDHVAAALRGYDALALTSLHAMTALMGSALLALAHAKGRLTAKEAWAAAHVDEDWQISQWGVDVEAAERRARQWAEMQAASRFLKLLAAG
jgi:chaperone required for assembly of F1-ATPase